MTRVQRSGPWFWWGRAFFVALLAPACASQESARPAELAAAAGQPPVASKPKVSEARELIPREHLFGNPERARGKLSPNGEQTAFIAPVEGVLNVWVGPSNDFDAARPVTNDEGRGIRIFNFLPNGNQLLYLQDRGGNENFHPFFVDLDTGKETGLGLGPQVRAIPVASSDRQPDRMLLGINDRDARLFDVYAIELATGERTLVEENPGFAGWLVDEDLEVRFGVQPTPDGGQIMMARSEAGWTPFLEISGADALSSQPLSFNDEGDGFYMLDSRGRNYAALVVIDAKTGEVRETLVEPDQADISDVIFDPTTHRPIAYATDRLRQEWVGLTPEGTKAVEQISAKLEGDWSVTSQTLDNGKWLVAEDRPEDPGQVYLFDRLRGTVDPFYRTRPKLSDAPLQPMMAFDIEARDGLVLPAYLTLPRGSDPDGDGKPAQPVPLVLNVHGGPWARDSFGYDPEHQWLANRGYGVLSVNFRGSTGLGKEFVNAGNLEWGQKMHDDLLDAKAWAERRGITSPGQTAIYGGSYGGYAVLAGLTFTPEAFACGVDIVGPSNLETLLASIPPYWAPLKRMLATRVGDPETEEGQELLRERSPLYAASDIKRPLLIAQGANDPRVKQAESEQIVEAMQKNELPVTYIVFPDEGHGFARPENRGAFYAVSELFLADCLGGRAEPIGDAFEGSSLTAAEGAEHVSGLPEALESHEPKTAG
ncbi:MAG: S9 family peptidase [Myxococcota bacterium]